jgi:hypothetical protein
MVSLCIQYACMHLICTSVRWHAAEQLNSVESCKLVLGSPQHSSVCWLLLQEVSQKQQIRRWQQLQELREALAKAQRAKDALAKGGW